MADAPDRRRFRIVRCLGRGGFGEVYLANMISAGGVRADVALKVLHTGLDPRSQAVQRLKDEARLLGLLNHPSILRIIDLVLLDDRVSLVTEYVDGADLDVCAGHATDPMPLAPLLEAMARIAEALAVAYSTTGPSGEPLHLLHRDVKPSNIRIGRHGEVKLLDFGIAKGAVDREAKTQTSAVLGSLPYLAPERYDREEGEDGVAGDVYALAATMYEAIRGERLLNGLSNRMHFKLAMSRADHDAKVAERLALLDVPDDVLALFTGMLAYDPAERPSLSDLGARLEDLAEEVGGPRLSRWCRKHPWDEVATVAGDLTGRTITEREISTSSMTYALDTHEVLAAPTTLEVNEAVALLQDDPVEPPSRSWLMAVLGVVLAVIVVGGGGVAVGGVGLVMAALRGEPVTDVPSVAVARAPEVPDAAPTVVAAVGDDPPASGGGTGGLPPGAAGTAAAADGGAGTPDDGEGTDTDTENGDGEADAAVDLGPRGAGRNQCGDPIALEPHAALGRLPASARSCLSAAMRGSDLSQTDRGDLGRLVLADALARCQSGPCADYEREQRYYFEEIDRSDAEMLYSWSTHLARAAGTSVDRLKEARLWTARALERKSAWSGADYVNRVDTLLQRDATLTNTLWVGDPEVERFRLDARNAAADWMAYRVQIGRDTAPALELCASAWGSAEACRSRTLDEVQQATVTFVSVPLGGAVYVDGAQVGEAPVVAQLDHGSHLVRVVVDGMTGEHTITVGADTPSRWTFRARDDEWEGSF